MTIKYIFLSCFLGLIFCSGVIRAQDYHRKKTVLERAHDQKITLKEFVTTKQKYFYAKIYSVDKVSINRTHHWFLKLVDLDGNPINYADVTLNGYYKNDPTIKFNYSKPIFKLCSEGKYVIGFVKVKNAGTWVLEATIKNGKKTDVLTYEIEIGNALVH